MKLFCIVLSLVGFTLAKPDATSTAKQNDNVCQTEFCRTTGKNMKSYIDNTTKPCDNFFQYSCGNWIKQNPLEGTTPYRMRFEETQKEVNRKIKNLYKSTYSQTSESVAIRKTVAAFGACVRAGANQALTKDTYRRLLGRDGPMGGFPMVIQSEFDETKVTHEKLFDVVSRVFYSELFFDLSVAGDIMHVNKNVIYLRQTSVNFKNKEIYTTPQNHTKKVNAYKKFIRDSAKHMVTVLGKPTTDAQIEVAVNEIWDLETKLKAILQPGSFGRNTKKTYHPKTVAQLKREYPNIVWDSLFRQHFAFASITVRDDDKIIVKTPEYLKSLNTLIANIPIRVMANYAHWIAILQKYALHGTDEMRTNLLEYRKVVKKVTKLDTREKGCLDTINSAFDGLGLANSHLFIREHFTANAKAKAMKMIEIMKTEYKERLERTSWLKPDELAESKCKVNLMIPAIGYPDWLNSIIDLDNYYHNLPDMTLNNLENIMNIKRFNSERDLLSYRDYTYGLDWPNPSAVNAYYDPKNNIIIFTAGIMQEPFFDEKYPEYMNYGGIGMIIGHEIGHGFDNKGRQFDSSRRVRNWWSEETITHFKSLEKCFVDQFTNYKIPELVAKLGDKARLNGTKFSGEIIGDYIGVTTGIEAFRELEKTEPQKKLPGFEDFTNDQMYFLSWAQSFCSHETPESALARNHYSHPADLYRINGAYSNSIEFQKAFKCGAETKMNNGNKKCHIY